MGIEDTLMNYNQIGMYKRPMNVFEKLSSGWTHMFANRWEWWYHLTQEDPKYYYDFWIYLNADMVAYIEETYYNGEE